METKKGRFIPEMRVFLSKLIKDPIHAMPSDYLKERGLTKSKLVNLLLKCNIIERTEKVTDGSTDEDGKPHYLVKYGVLRSNFERKMNRLYTRLFEKNLPPKKEKEEDINECGDCASVGGAFVAPINATPIRRSIIVTEEQLDLINSVISQLPLS
jgi:hypothetical protein